MHEIIDEAAVEAALAELQVREAPVLIELQPIEAWVLLGQLQLALRHPENTGPSAKITRVLARHIQARVAGSGVLAAVAEAGWQEVGGHG
jgi:hypothetical protein